MHEVNSHNNLHNNNLYNNLHTITIAHTTPANIAIFRLISTPASRNDGRLQWWRTGAHGMVHTTQTCDGSRYSSRLNLLSKSFTMSTEKLLKLLQYCAAGQNVLHQGSLSASTKALSVGRLGAQPGEWWVMRSESSNISTLMNTVDTRLYP